MNSLFFEEIFEQEVINFCSSLRSGAATSFDIVAMSLIKETFASIILRKSQGNSPRFAGSTKLRTASFRVLLFYGPVYNRSIFYHLISQSLSQSLS